GQAAVLREGGSQEGPVDGGGGPEARRLPPLPRPLLLEARPQARRAAEVRQELPPQVDQLPAPRPQAGPPLRRRGEARHRPPLAARQQVWSKIAARLPGRTDNEIKNHWNTHIRKKLKKMGLDPVTHQPVAASRAAHPEDPQQDPHCDGKASSQESAGSGTGAGAEEEAPTSAEPKQGAACSASTASDVSPSPCSSSSASASASASVATPGGADVDWPDPLDLFQVDAIIDMDWASILSGSGGGGNIGVDLFDQCSDVGFDQEVWM
uniref:Uncharacterized protein n=2 Tax=Aegilops tauschii subsp. strangulata TaxID=200361 RepID=A0A453PHS6_AEGTS